MYCLHTWPQHSLGQHLQLHYFKLDHHSLRTLTFKVKFFYNFVISNGLSSCLDLTMLRVCLQVVQTNSLSLFINDFDLKDQIMGFALILVIIKCLCFFIILQMNFLQSDWLRGGIYDTVYTVSKLPLKVPRRCQWKVVSSVNKRFHIKNKLISGIKSCLTL